MINDIETMSYERYFDENGQHLRFHMINGVAIKGMLIGCTDSTYVVARDIAGTVGAVVIIKNNILYIDVDPDL